jgi:tyrosyl-tRNA synthetase
LKLIRSFYPNNNDSFAVTFNLLTNKEGKKYSKSEAGNKAVKLTDDKRKFVDFFSNMSDEEVIKFAEQFTFLSKDQIKSLLALNVPPKLRILQRILLELMSYFCFNSKFFIEQTT